jgi:hypothetical protein
VDAAVNIALRNEDVAVCIEGHAVWSGVHAVAVAAPLGRADDADAIFVIDGEIVICGGQMDESRKWALVPAGSR